MHSKKGTHFSHSYLDNIILLKSTGNPRKTIYFFCSWPQLTTLSVRITDCLTCCDFSQADSINPQNVVMKFLCKCPENCRKLPTLNWAKVSSCPGLLRSTEIFMCVEGEGAGAVRGSTIMQRNAKTKRNEMEMNWNEKRQQMKATICIVFDICIPQRGIGKGLQIGLTKPRCV